MICIDDLIILRETYEEYLTGSIKVTVSPLRNLNTSRQEYFLFIAKNSVPRVHIWLSKHFSQCNRWQVRENIKYMFFLSWKGVLKDQGSSQSYWKNIEEKQWHINTLWNEICAKSLKPCINEEKFHIRVFPDCTVAIACIINIGISHLYLCHHFTKLIWEPAERKSIYTIAAQIPGVKKIGADRKSKEFHLTENRCYVLKTYQKPWCC